MTTVSCKERDENGANLRSASYYPNELNQYWSNTVLGAVDIMGVAFATSSVTVNNLSVYRKGEYFRKELAVDNSTAPVWTGITVTATGQSTVSGSAAVAPATQEFVYDLDGNLTQDGLWTYYWNGENRLVGMASSESLPDDARKGFDFRYDHQGRRIEKTVYYWDSQEWNYILDYTHRFVYDGWNLIAVLDGDNSPLLSFAWGTDLSGTMQGAGGVGGLLSVTVHSGANAGTYFYCYDGNGNVVALVNAADGTIAARYEYGPFGELLRATGPMAKANPFRFSTKYQDDETDLLYYGVRYLKTSTGGWLSRDPIGEKGGANLYGFAKNDGVNHIDKLGKQFCGYNCMPKDCDGVIDGPIRPTGCDVFATLINMWRSGAGSSYEIPSEVMQDLLGSGRNPNDLQQMKDMLKAQCRNLRPRGALMEHVVFETFTTAGAECEALFLGGHSRKFTGIADCCTGKGQICLDVNDIFDFDEDDPWPTGGTGDKIKWIGSRCFGVIFGIGDTTPTAGVPVHGRICIDIRL
jgi:RHS repeat-associated protein